MACNCTTLLIEAVCPSWPEVWPVMPYRTPSAYAEDMARVAGVAARVAAVQHENLVAVHDFGTHEDVRIMRLEPVGNYAARIVFDDTHDTGLYTWAYLRELGENKEARWHAYLGELAAKRLTR